MATTYEHSELLQGLEDGTLEITVDTERAAAFMNGDAVKHGYRIMHDCLSALTILSIPASFAVMFGVHIGAGAAMLFGLLPLLLVSVLWADESYIIEHSIDDEAFYDLVTAENVVEITPRVRKWRLPKLSTPWQSHTGLRAG